MLARILLILDIIQYAGVKAWWSAQAEQDDYQDQGDHGIEERYKAQLSAASADKLDDALSQEALHQAFTGRPINRIRHF